VKVEEKKRVMSSLVQLPLTHTEKTLLLKHAIYIGPERFCCQAAGVERCILPKSKWYVPSASSLNMYRTHVESHKNIFSLSELNGKTLVCSCNPCKRCHGNILLYLVESLVLQSPPINVVEFENDTSVFSNSYLLDFKVSGLCFFSLAHAYYYFLALAKNVSHCFTEEILNSPTLSHVVNIWKTKIPRVEMLRRCRSEPIDKICLFYELLLAKWKCSAEFRKEIRDKNQCLLVQASPDLFWGKGANTGSIVTYPGENIAGNLIMILTLVKLSGVKNRLHLFNNIKLRVVMVTKGILNTKFLQGLVKALGSTSNTKMRKNSRDLIRSALSASGCPK
jgi:predicted NAD-dependent protein-ADP-ribosyltransferase YbiA (DUF1768 family)